MAVQRHTFEGWTTGQTITTGGSGSGTPFTEAPVTGGTMVASTAGAVHGSRGMTLTVPTTEIAGAGWTSLNTSQISASAILEFPSNPPSSQRIINTYLVSGSSSSPHIDLLADGKVRLLNAAHGTVATSTGSVPLNVPVEYQLYAKIGTTTSDGTLHAKVIRRDTNTTLWDTGLLTSVNAATSNYNGIRMGIPSASVWTSDVTIHADDYAYSVDTDGLVEAYAATAASAGPDQSDVEPWTTVTLVGTGTGSWSQVSGAAVTLGGSGSTRTFTAPASLNTQTLVFSYGGDQSSIAILPATDAVRSGNQWRAVRFIRKV